MSTEILLPQWGTDMIEGTFVRWLKNEGDQVKAGEALAEVESEKVNANLEAPVSGILQKIKVPAGETAPIGAVVAIIEESR